MTKKVILTGLRANNDLHIGNYFGALLPIIDMAKDRAGEYQINLFVPDLHSFTTPIDHGQLQEQIRHNLRLFVASGLPLDNPDVFVYRQSFVPAHSELTWILDCFTGMGEMSRMTQYKEKRVQSYQYDTTDADSKSQKKIETEEGIVYVPENATNVQIKASDSVSVGLFNYPVLMASDILLYDAEYVPVGDDQTQHLEFTRDIAQRMNKKFGDLFVVPHEVKKQHEFFGKDQGLRIKDLADPTKKMSKSDDTGKGVIFLGDKPETAHKKVMSATTDSLGSINYDYEKQPGISNLIDILALLEGTSPKEVESRYKGQEMYGPFKKDVADKMAEFLTDFQTKLAQIDESEVNKMLARSEEAMNQKAKQTLLKLQKAVGLR